MLVYLTSTHFWRICLTHAIDIFQQRYDEDDDDEGPRPDPNLEQGMPLPIRMAAAFEPEMANIPLEDIDPFFHSIPVSLETVRVRHAFMFYFWKVN